MEDIKAFLQSQIEGGFGVREISRLTGVAASTISRVSSGKPVSIETANRILHPFGYKLAINRIGQHPIPTVQEGEE